MALPDSGTFDYVAIVPDHAGGSLECRATVREPVASTGNDLRDSRLVGLEPILRVTDAGLTPDPSPKQPRVMRSRITLKASGQPRAMAADASFHVDRALTSCLRPGDLIHLVRSHCGGIGLSVIRQDTLVVAIGAITRVPLGRAVEVSIPGDLIARAEAVFHERDAEFELPEYPLEIRVNAERSILYEGRRTIGDHGVFVEHGFRVGIPGTDECASIYQTRACPDTAAHASAMLLEGPGALSISRW